MRGALRRKGLGGGPALILDTAAKKAWRVAAGREDGAPMEFSEAEKELPEGIPLAPGFDEKTEAARRGVTTYHRESDEVFAGHACAIWRFDDDPVRAELADDDVLGRPDLDGLVVRWEREIPSPGGQGHEVRDQPHGRAGRGPPKLFSPPS